MERQTPSLLDFVRRRADFRSELAHGIEARVERSFLQATVFIDTGPLSSAIFSMGFLSCAFQSVKNRFTKEAFVICPQLRVAVTQTENVG
jgi:hypothetical protein